MIKITPTIQKGDVVLFADPHGIAHNALVTCVFGPADGNPSINVVYVSDDDAKLDSYGRQIERHTSVPHKINQYAHGMYWDWILP